VNRIGGAAGGEHTGQAQVVRSDCRT